MPTWLRYAIGLVIAVHGYVYVPFAFYLAWNGRPTHPSEQGLLGAAASLAVVIAGLAFADRIA